MAGGRYASARDIAERRPRWKRRRAVKVQSRIRRDGLLASNDPPVESRRSLTPAVETPERVAAAVRADMARYHARKRGVRI